jgi:hypothetical protein
MKTWRLAKPGAGESEFRLRRGPTFVWTRKGFRRVAGLFGVWIRIRDLAHRMTRWWRPRIVTSAVDAERGVITLSHERWSWRRWRWERS